MNAPQKPWERSGVTFQEGDNANTSLPQAMLPGRNVLNSNAPQMNSQPMGSVRTVVLPPLPPRPHQLSMSIPNRPSFGMAPNMFGSYSGYGGYPSYGGNYSGNMYLPGSYGYGSYGQPVNAFDNRFLQAAEESSRNAFQSIESLVRAFTSVSMMLESTYHAMYSSFRAILGVVDNFSRLRQLFVQFLSAITILRAMKNFYRRLLYWLGVLRQDPASEQIWEAVQTGGPQSSQTTNYSSWPLFTFIGLLFGGPYLISKLFSSNTTLEKKTWEPNKGTYCKTCYPHEAASEAELSFGVNELLNVAPPELQPQDSNGWLLATNIQGKVGYVPYNRLIIPKRQHPPSLSTENQPLLQNVDTSVKPE